MNFAGESSLRARNETANAKVITLQNELCNLNKKNDWLGTEISRLQNIEKEKAHQVEELKKEIKALNYQQQAHAQAHPQDINLVYSESNSLRERINSLEEKERATTLQENLGEQPYFMRKKPMSVQFQDEIGYIRASS